MIIELTKGMLGDVVEQIGQAATVEDANAIVQAWKDNNKDKYRVEPYFRILFYDDERAIAIDFGDYAYFIAIKCKSYDEWLAIRSVFGRT